MAKDIVKCADEGGQCQCPSGNIFYGRKHVVSGKEATFDEMNDEPYKYKKAEGPSIACTNAVFGDPTPGFAKQCFCDADSTYKQSEIDADGLKFLAIADKAVADSQAIKAVNDLKNAEAD